MTSIILGTAGHIDHGKTALVRALTGTDTDRLEEEKRRGISIDIGFAHLDLGRLRFGFVDVPGHERFVKNMLAGAGGIDAVMLVIAANESIRPQTREHFDICRLLGIGWGVVALTKADLVDAGQLELVRMEVEELVAGSFLDTAPVVAVSSVTHAGIEELKQILRQLGSAHQGRSPGRHFRLPVDRSFTRRGFGTVVTGTLIEGAVTLEQEVEVQPGGWRLRVRGLQVHGQAVGQAVAGERTALNLAGADAARLRRGQVLVAPGRFQPVAELACQLRLLASAPPLEHGAAVHFHAGTAQVTAHVRLPDPSVAVAPGTVANVLLRLAEPLLLLPGDRFIIRRFSPVTTIGGGSIIDIAPPRLRRPEMAARLAALSSAGAIEGAAVFLSEAPGGMSVEQLVARTGLLPEETARAGLLLALPEPWLMAKQQFHRLAESLEKTVSAFHEAHPLAPGIPLEQLRRLAPQAPAGLLRALVEQAGTLLAEGGLVRRKDHCIAPPPDQAKALARMEKVFEDAQLQPPPAASVVAGSGLDLALALALIETALRGGRLVRTPAGLIFHHSAIAELEALVRLHAGETFTIAAFKNWTGVSRKYAVPLLEYLDSRKLTRRQGEHRVVIAPHCPIG